MRLVWAGAVVVAVIAAAVVSRRPEHPAWRTATPAGGRLVGLAVVGREVVTVDPVRPGGPVPLLRRFDAMRGTPLGVTAVPVPPGFDRIDAVAAPGGERAVVGAVRTAGGVVVERADAQVIDLHTGRPAGKPVRPHPRGPAVVSADGRWLAYGDGDPAAATPRRVTVVDFSQAWQPPPVPLPAGATADAAFGDRDAYVLVRPPGDGPRRLVEVSWDAETSRHRERKLPAGPDWSRLGRVRTGTWRLYATAGPALQAYQLNHSVWKPTRESDADRTTAPDDHTDECVCVMYDEGWKSRLHARPGGTRVVRVAVGKAARVEAERDGLPADARLNPDGLHVVTLDDRGALCGWRVVPPPAARWPAAVAGAVPLLAAAAVATLWASPPPWGGVKADVNILGVAAGAGDVVVVERAIGQGRAAIALVRFDGATGEPRFRSRIALAGDEDRGHGLTGHLSPDGTRAVVAIDQMSAIGPSTAKYGLFDTATGERLRQFPECSLAEASPFSPCGRWLGLAVTRGTPAQRGWRVYAAADGVPVPEPTTPGGAAEAGCFAADGNTVAVSRQAPTQRRGRRVRPLLVAERAGGPAGVAARRAGEPGDRVAGRPAVHLRRLVRPVGRPGRDDPPRGTAGRTTGRERTARGGHRPRDGDAVRAGRRHAAAGRARGHMAPSAAPAVATETPTGRPAGVRRAGGRAGPRRGDGPAALLVAAAATAAGGGEPRRPACGVPRRR